MTKFSLNTETNRVSVLSTIAHFIWIRCSISSQVQEPVSTIQPVTAFRVKTGETQECSRNGRDFLVSLTGSDKDATLIANLHLVMEHNNCKSDGP